MPTGNSPVANTVGLATLFTATQNGAVPASGGAHGAMLRADGTWATPSTASTASAGYVAALPGNSMEFFRGDGTWATPTAATYGTFTVATAGLVPSGGVIPSQFLRADATWATPSGGGGGGGDMLTTQINAEVNITSAATLTMSAWNHIAGSAASYTATLPVLSSNYGKFVGILIDSAATVTTTIKGAGSDSIDGSNTRIMWANETAVLYGDQTANKWVKVAGKTIPMVSSLFSGSNQTFGNSTATKLNFTSSNFNNAPTAFQQAASAQFTIQRPGNYMVEWVSETNGTNSVAGPTQSYIYLNGSLQFQQVVTSSASSQFFTVGAYQECSLALGTTVQAWGYYNGGSMTTSYLLPGAQFNYFQITESPIW